jgi:hypothetical protein
MRLATRLTELTIVNMTNDSQPRAETNQSISPNTILKKYAKACSNKYHNQ